MKKYQKIKTKRKNKKKLETNKNKKKNKTKTKQEKIEKNKQKQTKKTNKKQKKTKKIRATLTPQVHVLLPGQCRDFLCSRDSVKNKLSPFQGSSTLQKEIYHYLHTTND